MSSETKTISGSHSLIAPVLGCLARPILSSFHAKGLISSEVWSVAKPILQASSAFSCIKLAEALETRAEDADKAQEQKFEAALKRRDRVIIVRGSDGGALSRLFAFWARVMGYCEGTERSSLASNSSQKVSSHILLVTKRAVLLCLGAKMPFFGGLHVTKNYSSSRGSSPRSGMQEKRAG